MNTVAKKLLWIGLGLAVVLSVLWSSIPLPDAGKRLSTLPIRGLGFASQEIPLTATEKSIYGEATAVKRVYQFGHRRFILVAIDGTRNRHAVHDPLYCFRGAGWLPASEERFPISGGEACRVRLHRDREEAEALFWFTDGRTRHGSAMRYWWQTTLRRLTFGKSGGEPVLMLLQPAAGEPSAWESALQAVAGLQDV